MTSGADNVALGANAADAVNSGSCNIAIGINAYGAATTASPIDPMSRSGLQRAQSSPVRVPALRSPTGEDHNINGGLSDLMTSYLANNNFTKNRFFYKFGVKNFPACGTPEEVLKHHNLDYLSISSKIKRLINNA